MRIFIVNYGVSGEIQLPFYKYSEPKDLQPSIAWSDPGTSEVRVRLDNGAEADAVNLPVDRGNTFSWAYTAGEATSKITTITFIDSAGSKEHVDETVLLLTWGFASAFYASVPADVQSFLGNPVDLDGNGFPGVNVKDVDGNASTAVRIVTHMHANGMQVDGFSTAGKAEVESEVKDAIDAAGIVKYRGTLQAGSTTQFTAQSGHTQIRKGDLLFAVSGAGALQAEYVDTFNPGTLVGTFALALGTAVGGTTVYTILSGGSIPGASAPTAAQVAAQVFAELFANHDAANSFGAAFNDILAFIRNKVAVDQTTGEQSVYKLDGTTVRFQRTPTEIDANTVGMVPS